MHSAIYKGYLRHRRYRPKAHRFCYRVFMMYLDLDELESVLQTSRWWSRKSWRPARFVREDFLGDPRLPLADAVRKRIFEETGREHRGPVRLLANLRYFGYSINPISVYYCFDDAEKLQFIVSEVTNTPWGERQSYVLECDPERATQRIGFQKLMHVSPFNPMNMDYQWRCNCPGKVLSLNLDAEIEGETHVDATLALKRHEIDAQSMAGVLLQYPWMTAKVAFTIYWQALKIWVKRNPFYDHPRFGKQAPLEQSTITRLKTKA